jgi:hypothetical protein
MTISIIGLRRASPDRTIAAGRFPTEAGEIQRNENQVDEVSLLDRPQGRTGMAISRDSALADRKISW